MMAKRFNQNGRVIILSETTDEPISMIGQMAGICWGADTSSNEKNFKRGLDCLNSGHGRTFEYPQIYMKIGGYSARVIREFTRHLGGVPTYLQESTRYVDSKNFDYVVPPSIKNNGTAKVVYESTMREIRDCLHKLDMLGVPKEDSAMALPLGMTTKIVYRTNLRNLIDMSHQRLCSRAYWEYRELMADILEALSIYSDEWNYLVNDLKVFVPKCEYLGRCPEKKSCGRYNNWFKDLEDYCKTVGIKPTSVPDLVMKLKEIQEDFD